MFFKEMQMRGGNWRLTAVRSDRWIFHERTPARRFVCTVIELFTSYRQGRRRVL